MKYYTADDFVSTYTPPKAAPKEPEIERNDGIIGDTVDAFQMGALQSISGIANFFGADDIASSLDERAKSQMDTMSDEGRDGLSKAIYSDEGGFNADAASDIDYWLLNVASLVGQMASTIPLGGVGGKAVSVLGNMTKVGRAAGNVLSKAPAGLGSPTALGVGVAGGAAATGMAGTQAEDIISSTDFQTLSKSDKYLDELSVVVDDNPEMGNDELLETARQNLAEKVSNEVMQDPKLLAANFAGSFLGDNVIGGIFKNRLQSAIGKNISGPFKGATSRSMNALKGGVAEGITEAGQGATEQRVINENLQPIDGRDVNQGVFAAGVNEGVLGSVAGAGTSFAFKNPRADALEANGSPNVAGAVRKGEQELEAAKERAKESTPTEPSVAVAAPSETPPQADMPDTTEPDVTVPDVTEPDVTVPDSTEPDVTVPDSTEPDVTVPDSTEPAPAPEAVIQPPAEGYYVGQTNQDGTPAEGRARVTVEGGSKNKLPEALSISYGDRVAKIKTGDTITVAGDFGYSADTQGESKVYEVEQVGKDGSLYVKSANGNTLISRAEMSRGISSGGQIAVVSKTKEPDVTTTPTEPEPPKTFMGTEVPVGGEFTVKDAPIGQLSPNGRYVIKSYEDNGTVVATNVKTGKDLTVSFTSMEKATERGARIEVPTVAPAAVSATVTDNPAPESEPTNVEQSPAETTAEDGAGGVPNSVEMAGDNNGKPSNTETETEKTGGKSEAIPPVKSVLESDTVSGLLASNQAIDVRDAADWLRTKSKSKATRAIMERINALIPSKGVMKVFTSMVSPDANLSEITEELKSLGMRGDDVQGIALSRGSAAGARGSSDMSGAADKKGKISDADDYETGDAVNSFIWMDYFDTKRKRARTEADLEETLVHEILHQTNTFFLSDRFASSFFSGGTAPEVGAVTKRRNRYKQELTDIGYSITRYITGEGKAEAQSAFDKVEDIRSFYDEKIASGELTQAQASKDIQRRFKDELTENEFLIMQIYEKPAYFTKPTEVVSWALTDPAFQRLLKKIKTNGKVSTWKKFTRAMMQALGVPLSERTALTDLMDITDDMYSYLGDAVAKGKIAPFFEGVSAAKVKKAVGAVDKNNSSVSLELDSMADSIGESVETKANPVFKTSTLDEGLQGVLDEANNATASFVTKAKNWIKDPSRVTDFNLADQARRNRFGLLTLRQIAEVAKDIFIGPVKSRGLQGDTTSEDVSLIQAYASRQQQMQTKRNERASLAADMAEKVNKWAQKYRKTADKLFTLMHDATISGVDPSLEKFVEGRDVIETRLDEVNNSIAKVRSEALATKAAEIAVIDEKIKGLLSAKKTPTTATKKKVIQLEQAKTELRKAALKGVKKELAVLQKERREMKDELSMEGTRRAAYDALRKQWLDMYGSDGGKEGAKYYAEMRDSYAKNQQDYHKAMMDKITRNIEDPVRRKQMLKRAEFQFQFNKIRAPYFPLHRQGKYFINLEDKTGERVFLMQETKAEMERAIEGIKKLGKYDITEQGLLEEKDFSNDGASISFMQDLESLVDGLDVEGSQKGAMKDSIYQLYLTHTPDRSMRRGMIHRKGIKGFSQDAVRAYADTMMKSSYQLSKMEASDDLADIVKSIQRLTDEKGKSETDADKAVVMREIANEMKKRHEWVMNPDQSEVANKITGLGFVYFLGISPAAALINLTQTLVVGLPILAARFKGDTGGYAGGMRELMNATKLIRVHNNKQTGKWEISIPQKNLTDDEARAMREWKASGLIDITRAHDLAGIAEYGTYDYNATYHKAMDKVSWFYHYAEVINRQTTALAAYRLARQEGLKPEEAQAKAAKATWDSHFDYSNSNRARFMQGAAPKVMFQFRQYSQQITFHLMHSAIRMWKHRIKKDPTVSKEEYLEMRTQLVGTLGITGLMGGINAMPVLWLAYLAAEIINGDDLDEGEEPIDAQAATYTYIADKVGKDAADWIIYGAGGAGLSSRISLEGLWVNDRQIREASDSQKTWNTIAQAFAGPVMGGLMSSMIRGIDLLNDGEYQKGIEKMVPKAFRDFSKATRYATEGATNYKNEMLKTADEFNPAAIAMVALGISNSEVSRLYQENNAIKNLEQKYIDQRRALMTAFYNAILNGDLAERREVTERIKVFNRTVPRYPISSKNLRQSIRGRNRDRADNRRGLDLNNNLKYLGDQYDWSDISE